ncbi:helix-turn-helix transcriptional regulator [Bacillus sp. JJ722]|uniref:helix-turn-helix transcriptional regulator n=1 Tax=Bacillus sp. JJ722 TaxID=3122973 RepID=UPI002FFF2025
MPEIPNGQRLLKLRDILLEETDENNELGINEIIDKLKATYGTDFHVDRRSIKRDLEMLHNEGFEIIENAGKFGKVLYSHQERLFETYQLRLLIDPILSARFITGEEKNAIVNNIKKLTSKHLAKSLPDPIHYNQSINEDYQLIKLHIDKIHHAIKNNVKLTFQYGEYNIDKQFCLRKSGARYELKPYALIWESDFYYLIGEHVRHENLSHYRLDRMRNVETTTEKFLKKPLNVSEYVQSTFQMFGGEEQWIKIQFFDTGLINPVIDKLGLHIDMKNQDDNSFIIATKVKLSKGLINWIISWGDQAKVISPSFLVDEIKGIAKNMASIYEE